MNRVDHSSQTVELTNCVHCGSVVLNAPTDICPVCGEELEPISRIVPPGSAIGVNNGVLYCKKNS